MQAADGTLLAQSIPTHSQTSYHYLRQYPQGSLYSQVVGYASPIYGTAGLEYQYNDSLVTHTLPAQSFSQVLGLSPRQSTRDNLTLTIDPKLQETTRNALSQIVGPNKDAAIFAVDPKTGAVVADYSTPSFDPNLLASPSQKTENVARYADYLQRDSEGFFPGADPLQPGRRPEARLRADQGHRTFRRRPPGPGEPSTRLSADWRVKD